MHKKSLFWRNRYRKGKVEKTLALRIVTYLNDVELSLLNHGDAYNIIKSASSYEDCFASAMSYSCLLYTSRCV